MGALAESSVDTEVGTGERLVTDTIYGIPEKSSRAAPRGFGWPRTVGKSSIISSVRIRRDPGIISPGLIKSDWRLRLE